MGDKVSAINAMKKAGVPTVPGSDGINCGHFIAHQANGIGFRANKDKTRALNLLGKIASTSRR
jgi:biotin carboxylase